MATALDLDAPRASAVQPFLRALLLARKNLQLYPATNPAVDDALENAVALLPPLVADGPLALRFRRDGITIDGAPVEDPDGRVGRMAEDLFRRAVGVLTFESHADRDDLRAVLQVLSRPVEDLLSTGGPAAQPTVAMIDAIRIDHAEGVTIVAGDQSMAAMQQLVEQAEAVVDREQLDRPEGGERFFVGVGDGDPDRLAALEALLATPERLTLLFRTFAVRVHEHVGEDHGLLVSQLMRVIEAAGQIILALPDEGSRQRAYRSLAEMVRGLDPQVGQRMVVDGLLPDVAAGGVAARVMRLFPVPEVANALARSIIQNEENAAILPETIGGLSLEADEHETLALLTHGHLENAGAMTPELNSVFNDVVFGALPESTTAAIKGTETMLTLLPSDSALAAEDLQWERHEYRKARREARRASLRAADLDLLPLLQEFIHMAAGPDEYLELLEQAQRAILGFLSRGQFAAALELLHQLYAQHDERSEGLTADQQARADRAFAGLIDPGTIQQLLRILDEAEGGALEARQILEYFRALGMPLVTHLLDRLDAEEHRHMRLLLCRTIARLSAGRVQFLSDRLRHPQWFVARNVMTIAAEMATEDALPLAVQAARHSEPRVVREALKSLAKIRRPEALAAIRAALHGPDPEIQAAAASWLGIVGGEQAVGPLVGLLQADPYRSDRTLMLTVIEALGRIGSPDARAALEPVARTRVWFGGRRRRPLRDAARAALAAPPVRTS